MAFLSSATNLLPGRVVPVPNLYVRDLATGSTELVSVSASGGIANGDSDYPIISVDGRRVAFSSDASNLVSGDTNGVDDVFARDLVAHTTTLVSVTSGGRAANGPSTAPSISADGRYVAFTSSATNLVPDDRNGLDDVFVRDLRTGVTTRVSVDTAGGDANGESSWVSISGDGTHVAFASMASDLVVGDGNEVLDVFVRALASRVTTRVSVAADGGDTTLSSFAPSVSADGRYVAFSSSSGDLIGGTIELESQNVFVRDVVGSTTAWASVNVVGAQPSSDSGGPSISADGRYVAFASRARDLVPGEGFDDYETFVRDLVRGATTVESVNSSDAAADSRSGDHGLGISANGQWVVFASLGGNLDPTDTNLFDDVYVHHRQPPSCFGRPATISGAGILRGTNGPDVIVGSSRPDTIDGGGGRDLICAGDGNDHVSGGGGADRIDGGAGDDVLQGGSGDDVVHGGPGTDRCAGGAGRDHLDGCETVEAARR